MTSTLEKDRRVYEFLALLARHVSPDIWQVVDHWEADRLAIGIAKSEHPVQLVYVSFWRARDGHCTYQLERADSNSAEGFAGGRMEEDAPLEVAIGAIRRHLLG